MPSRYGITNYRRSHPWPPSGGHAHGATLRTRGQQHSLCVVRDGQDGDGGGVTWVGDVPQPGGPVEATGQQGGRVGAEVGADDDVGVAAQGCGRRLALTRGTTDNAGQTSDLADKARTLITRFRCYDEFSDLTLPSPGKG
jgi:hypothetical protein